MTDRVVIVIPGENPSGTQTPAGAANPYYLRQPQPWALRQVQQHHDEALYLHGEYAVLVRMWRVADFNDGLVTRCSECFSDPTHDVFKQPSKKRCPTCYGTTFEGGVKDYHVLPTLWDLNTPETQEGVRGESVTNAASVQAPPSVRLRVGDYAFRADGTRWQMRQPSTNLLRTGFDHVDHDVDSTGFNYGQFDLEDPTAVAYIIPPVDRAELATLLRPVDQHYPSDFTDVEADLLSRTRTP